MPSGARFNGVDFDDIFEPGTVVASSSLIRQGGGPLQYAARGSVPKYRNVGLRVGGSDVSNLWLPKGSAPPKLPIDGQSFFSSAGAPTGATGTTSATVVVSMNSNGTYEVRAQTTNGVEPPDTTLVSGTWLPSGGNVADYRVQFVGSAGAGTGIVSNGATSLVALTTSRTFSLSVSVPSASGQSRADSVSPLYIVLQRVGAGSSSTAVTLDVSAIGYL